jgi:outer membrane protein assembly factor BamA
VSFPLTWGGTRRAAIEVQRIFDGPVVSSLEGGASVERRRHPFYRSSEDRQWAWVTARRSLATSLAVSGTAAWQQVALTGPRQEFLQTGADIVLDTRFDPVLPRNAIYARAGWTRSHVPDGPVVNQTTADVRAYLGLPRGSVLVVRGLREDADRSVPPYLKSLLGGMPNLRGFRRGIDVGDTLAAGSVELLAPLTSPLRIGRFGVSAFVDVGTTYDQGQRLRDQKLERAVGAGVWFSAAVLKLNVAVARGLGGTTRVHVAAGISP